MILQRERMPATRALNPLRFSRRALDVLVCAFLLTVFMCGAGAPASRAQEAPASSARPLTASTEIVRVDTSVLDNRGNFVGGLARSNFRILDNGTAQPVVFFTPVEAPAQVLVMLETSPAVYLIHDQHLVAAYALLDGLAADDQVALVSYDETPREVLKFTADKSALLAALNGVQYTIGMGDLNFYDSISQALDWLGPAPGKRALVILSTGLDSSPPAHWDALVSKLRSEDAVIFAVGLGGSLRGASAQEIEEAGAAGIFRRRAIRESRWRAALARHDYRRPRVFPPVRKGFRAHLSRDRFGAAPPICSRHCARARRPVSCAHRRAARRERPADECAGEKARGPRLCPRRIFGPGPVTHILRLVYSLGIHPGTQTHREG